MHKNVLCVKPKRVPFVHAQRQVDKNKHLHKDPGSTNQLNKFKQTKNPNLK